jgi:IclR helix-turn-helix domain
VSELLDRIEKEIRERLAATRAAVLEHERLQAALQALTETGEDAARAVKGRVRRPGARDAEPAPTAPAPPPVPAPAAAEPAPATPRSPARRKPPAPRPRAPRGANREAVLKVVGERPGVTNAELSAASGVQRGTLSTLLRTLVTRGELEKRSLPGGKVGYALAASAPAAAADSGPEAAPSAAADSEPEAAPTAAADSGPEAALEPAAADEAEPGPAAVPGPVPEPEPSGSAPVTTAGEPAATPDALAAPEPATDAAQAGEPDETAEANRGG